MVIGKGLEFKGCLFLIRSACVIFINNHMLNVLQAENRILDFDTHESSDELFYCIEGEFDIEFRERFTHLCTGDLIIIPKGVKHRSVCQSLVKYLLIELEGLFSVPTLRWENNSVRESASCFILIFSIIISGRLHILQFHQQLALGQCPGVYSNRQLQP